MTLFSALHAPPLTVFVEGIGLLGPGLGNWVQGRGALEGTETYQAAPCIVPLPMALPAAERRRAGTVVKVALAVGQEAVTASGLQASALPSVFTSSSGDGLNCHEICSALASSDRLISPTRFHNSVHNAASGYWSISSGAMVSSSVLCAFDGSFAAGLLEAMAQVMLEQTAVLLVAYDTDYPEPLRSVRPVPDTFGVGLVLAPRRSERSLAQWRLASATCLTGAPAQRLEDDTLERLRSSIPAARCLPLLRSVAAQTQGEVVLDYLECLQLAVQVAPCL
ncbi:beta-ketoacyl synthase chain length factor [Rhodoferax ferrireducens]|uniref:beta-ketoacyl synthase chain length factor n=1 Tax=Rhodoferax ferrireducens TaxID=192843 RepID=UPI00298E9DC6|nr:beta-ketoacyl synthase chain length factor [Rhodoferax ferrireducens]WPC66737.1 beta-ketoacyl synthase chain length factor [Rhodoferax ferrireducens]